jgi:ADP-heptose:LPS heptosyltransferase
MWTGERWTSLLESFLNRHGLLVVVVVGYRHAGVAQASDRVLLAYGNSLDASMALVAAADMFIGVDSCMLHVADFFRVPGVGLFGPTRASEFGFFLAPSVHIQAQEKMDDIQVEDVLGPAERLLAYVKRPFVVAPSAIRKAD